MIRLGKVVQVTENGMISVKYEDNSATDPMPVLAIFDESKYPDIGDTVAVGKMKNGGVVLGKVWNKSNAPECTDKWYKKISDTGYMKDDGVITMHDTDIKFEIEGTTITLSQLLQHIGLE